jgi:hypothetical protein
VRHSGRTKGRKARTHTEGGREGCGRSHPSRCCAPSSVSRGPRSHRSSRASTRHRGPLRPVGLSRCPPDGGAPQQRSSRRTAHHCCLGLPSCCTVHGCARRTAHGGSHSSRHVTSIHDACLQSPPVSQQSVHHSTRLTIATPLLMLRHHAHYSCTRFNRWLGMTAVPSRWRRKD